MAWVQINVGFSRRDGDALPAARAVFAELAPAVKEMKAEGGLRRFFFMRKPPDVRLRFEADEPEVSVVPTMEKILKGLRDANAVTTVFRTIYEPEVGLFGGAEAMDLVHSYFDLDSGGWIEMDRLAGVSQRTISKAELVTATLDDLFCKVLDDSAEVWDVWRNIRCLIDAEPLPEAAPAAIPSLGALILPPSTAGEVSVLIAYAAANRELSDGLQRLWRSGLLQCGLRGLLAHIGVFVLNRHGLNGPLKSAIAEGVCRLRDPMRALIGGEADAAFSAKLSSLGS